MQKHLLVKVGRNSIKTLRVSQSLWRVNHHQHLYHSVQFKGNHFSTNLKSTSSEKFQFAHDLDIYFSFNYTKQSTQLKEQSSGIHFILDGNESQNLMNIFNLGMKILASSNAQEKVQLTQQVEFLPSQNNTNISTTNSVINQQNMDKNLTEELFKDKIKEMQNEYFKSYSGKDYIPGRPELPILLDDMKQIPTSYKQAGVSLPVFLLHNMAHIELNAIDLCWNTIVMALLHPIRYKTESDITDGNCLDLFDFINDFIKVAKDEARHFSELSQRLVELSRWSCH